MERLNGDDLSSWIPKSATNPRAACAHPLATYLRHDQDWIPALHSEPLRRGARRDGYARRPKDGGERESRRRWHGSRGPSSAIRTLLVLQ